MRWVRRPIGVAIVAAVVVGGWIAGWRFAAENAMQVSVHYLWGSREVALWQALVIAFALGFGVAALGWLLYGVRARLVQRRYRKELGELESEIHQLRNLPLAADSPTLGRSRSAPPDGASPRTTGGRNG